MTLFITMDCLRILKKINMEQTDFPILKQALRIYLTGSGLDIAELLVCRVDFARNIKLPDEERALMISILQKASIKAFYVRRHERYERYETSIYYKSKSRTIQLYDKPAERRSNRAPVMTWEQGVLRFEYQLKLEHLKYLVRKNKKQTEHSERIRDNIFGRHFDDILNWPVYCALIGEALKHTFYYGDFWSIDRATVRLNKSELSQSMKVRLRTFLVDISRSGMDKACKKRNSQTAQSYRRLLQELNINPILIPKNQKKSFLKNPFSAFVMENGFG